MKLYEIASDYARLLEAVETGEIPEEAIADTLESITSIIEEKADNIACMIKNMKAEAEAIGAEEKRLKERRLAKEKRIESLTAYLSETLQNMGLKKVETARNRISFRKSEKVAIADEVAFLEWAKVSRGDFLTYAEPTLNRTAIKDAIKGGAEIAGAKLETNQNIQIK